MPTSNPTNLGHPYSTYADEQAKAKQYAGRFVHQIPSTDVFTSPVDGKTFKPFESEVAVDNDGFLGFIHWENDSEFKFVSRTKEIYEQMKSLIGSGILDKLIGVNNNLEFYYAYKNANNFYPNPSLAFPYSYNYFSVHADATSDSVLTTTISNSPEQASNGKLPLVKLDVNSDVSFMKLPNFITQTDAGFGNGKLFIVRFYTQNTGADDPVIAEKLFQVRSISNLPTSGTTSQTPISMKITNSSVGTLRLSNTGDYVLVVNQSDDLTKLKFYGVVYYGVNVAASTVEYYYRNLEIDDSSIVADGSTIKVKCVTEGVTLTANVLVKVVPNTSIDHVAIVSWLDSKSGDGTSYQTTGYCRVFGSTGAGNLMDITDTITITDGSGVAFTNDKEKIRFNYTWSSVLDNQFFQLAFSSDTYDINVTEASKFHLHFPTVNQITNVEKHSAYTKSVLAAASAGGDTYTDYCTVRITNGGATPTVTGVTFRLNGTTASDAESYKKIVANSISIEGIGDTFGIRIRKIDDTDVCLVTGKNFSDISSGVLNLSESAKTAIDSSEVLIVEFLTSDDVVRSAYIANVENN